MDPVTRQMDQAARAISLDKLRRLLMYVGYDWLELEHLQPLREEIEAKLKAIYMSGR